jgi:hypothetical protein
MEVMIMNKKGLKTKVGAAVAGCLLLAFSIAAFATSGSGYESYKDAVKSTILVENATVNAQFEVKDNGSVILSGDSIDKLDTGNMSSKTNVTVDGVSKTYESSNGSGKHIMIADGKYYAVNMGDRKCPMDKDGKFSASSSEVKLAEMITDTLVGDVKNQFVKDGQTISVNLAGAQIPELAKLALSAAIEDNHHRGDFKGGDKIGLDGRMESVMDKMPKLSNIDIKSIAMTATVDGNTLKDNKFTVTLTGQDANSVSHEFEIMLSAKISNVGNTKIDTIDTTGKEVNTIDWGGRGHNR